MTEAESQRYRIDQIELEREGLGVPSFTMPEGYSRQDEKKAATWAKELANHESTNRAVLPSNWNFEIMGLKSRLRTPHRQPHIDGVCYLLAGVALGLVAGYLLEL